MKILDVNPCYKQSDWPKRVIAIFIITYIHVISLGHSHVAHIGFSSNLSHCDIKGEQSVPITTVVSSNLSHCDIKGEQSVPITTVVSSNPANGEVYSIQHYVIKFVSDM